MVGTGELLPCPFCGGEAEILTAESMYGGNLYGVLCDCCAGRTDVFVTEAEAIAAWNSRAEPTCQLTLDGTDGNFGCSECLENIPPLSNYCPHCGAKVVSE